MENTGTEEREYDHIELETSEDFEKWLNETFEPIDLFDEDADFFEEINESENLFKEAKESYNKVDDKLLDFIHNFVVNQDGAARQKKRLKEIFFWFTMICFAIIVLTPIACFAALTMLRVSNYIIVLGSITAAVVEVLTTVIILPKIVAEYLFNKEEENSNIKIVEIMQKYSETIHGYDKD